MKKVLLMLALGLFAGSAFAQEKGDVTIGGTFSYTHAPEKVDGEKSGYGNSSFTILPALYYFLSNKVAVGFGIGYVKLAEASVFQNSDNRQFVFAPGVKYYSKIADNFYYTPEFSLGFGSGTNELTYYYLEPTTTQKYKTSGFSLGVSILDFEFRPSNKIGLGLSCGSVTYTTTTAKQQNEVVVNNFNINFLNSYLLSLKFYL